MNPTNDIHDIKGLVPVPHSLWWLWVGLALVVVAVLAVWWWQRRRPQPLAPVVVPPTPFQVALAALQQLRAENPPVEIFYTRLADIVRQYLEGRFSLRAPEWTTEEFLAEVAQTGTLAAAHKNLLGAFLQEADLVKFARFQPGAADRQRAFEAAEKFVRDTQS